MYYKLTIRVDSETYKTLERISRAARCRSASAVVGMFTRLMAEQFDNKPNTPIEGECDIKDMFNNLADWERNKGEI